MQEGQTFGELLRRYREAAGLSQEALAERAGLTGNAIGALERGERKRPYPHTISLLVDALGLDKAERAALTATIQRRGNAVPALPAASAPVAAPLPGIPGYLTALIGRERERAAVYHLLGRPEVRLLTLTGPGGIGKTRLALAIATGVQAWFPDGVAFVSLAALRDPALVLRAVAQVVGAQEANEAAVREALAATLAGKQFLLVLDNFEHLLAAAPEITALLLACPALKVLVTSRATLRVSGEQEYRVPPLGLPQGDHAADPAALEESAAARLFIARARAVQPDFALTHTNAAAVATICARLGGLPLALELAAARIALFPPAALLSRLERGLGVLAGGPRDLPERQRTMRDAIAWSHDLLTAEEQRLFRRLAVFAGGWTLDAAEAVDDGPWTVDSPLTSVHGLLSTVSSPPSTDTLETLAALVAKSLVVSEASEDEPRYHLLEPMRQFALERLETAGEDEAVRARHAAWCLAFVRGTAQTLRGPEQVAWLDQLETELDNLRAALGWAFESGRRELGLRLASDLDRFWHYRAHQSEGRRWLERGLGTTDTLAPQVRASALALAGYLTFFQGELDRAEGHFAEGAVLFRDLGDRAGSATIIDGLADLAYVRRDNARARALHEENRALRRELGDRWGVAMSTMGVGLSTLGEGDVARARPLLEESLGLMRAVGDPRGIATMLLLLGWVAVDEMDAARVEVILAESLRLSREAANMVGVVECLEGLACAAGLRGDPVRAARLAGAAATLRDTIRVSVSPNIGLYERHLTTARRQVAPATWDAALAAGRALGQDAAIAEALGTNVEESLS
jgi:predicted ATPase/transcriptional regulator with XRE-family HTH domain